VSRQMVARRKTAPLNIYVAPELKEAAMRAAKADQRSLTSLIEKLLTDYCRATGFLPKGGTSASKGKGK
jgi:predicted HicB family RNase H-like nuclease